MRVQPFIDGWMNGLKPQLTRADRELLAKIFKGHRPFSFSTREEMNPAKAPFYFKFGAAHLNVLLPVWILNQRSSSAKDRFRIGATYDHSVIFDTKDNLIYDPTTEAIYQQPDYLSLRTEPTWKEEALRLVRDELTTKTFAVFLLTERLENLQDLHVQFARNHYLIELAADELRGRIAA